MIPSMFTNEGRYRSRHDITATVLTVLDGKSVTKGELRRKTGLEKTKGIKALDDLLKYGLIEFKANGLKLTDDGAKWLRQYRTPVKHRQG